MDKPFSHLIWLGAGTASSPASLLSLAEKTILVEAREDAYLRLRERAPQDAKTYNFLIAPESRNVVFNEYNLAEYSATKSATDLCTLFPGLKNIRSDSRESLGISTFISSLQLQDNNNVLIVDILDENLSLLKVLTENNQLQLFKSIQVQTSLIPLYDNAANSHEIIQFLEKNGYFLQASETSDPDLPWLSFNLNPFFADLTQKKLEITNLSKKIAELTEQLNETTSHLASTERKQSEDLKILSEKLEEAHTREQQTQAAEKRSYDLSTEATLKLAELEKSFAFSKEDNKKEIETMSSKIAQLEKQSAFRLERINQLEKSNNQLNDENKSLLSKEKLMREEMLKAEAQINIIKEILIKQ